MCAVEPAQDWQGKVPLTFQGPLRIGQPGEGGSLREVPLEPLLFTGSFANLWGEVGGMAELGVVGREAQTSVGLEVG
jgi:hypothetical protein